jgi:small subunit ribosomal protein S21
LAQVKIHEGESFESLMRRFSKKVEQAGIISETRRRAFYEKPSVKRKRKDAVKRRKSRRSP